MSDFHIWVQIPCDGDNVKVKDISKFETGPYCHSAKNSILIEIQNFQMWDSVWVACDWQHVFSFKQSVPYVVNGAQQVTTNEIF